MILDHALDRTPDPSFDRTPTIAIESGPSTVTDTVT
jgi:hypothetical protein